MSTIRESEAVAGPIAAPRPAERRQRVVPRGPAALLALQRAAGNRAVAAAVQRPAAQAGAAVPPAVGAELASAAPELAAPENVAERAAAASAPPAPPAPPAPRGGGTTVQRGILDDIADAAGEALDSARRSAMTAVTDYAKRIPGYDLLCTVLGKDVITDAPVARSAAKLIDGFLALIPGSERIRQNLQESRATEKAGQWLEEEVPKLGLSWEVIKGLFQRAWDALSITDLADPEAAFRKIQSVFGGPLGRLRDFAVAAGKKLLEFVFEGALSLAGSAGDAVMGIIRRAGGVFEQIVADPMRFLGNLVNAVRGGLSAFMTNVGNHLKNGLVAWLTGSLGGVIRLPEKFDLKGILGMVLDFLGLTWSRVKGKLGRLIGADVLEMLETGVDKLQKGAGFIGDLFKRGLSAITDRIAEFASGLVGQVMDGIRDWVARSVVGAAITKLISMFNPAGAVIQAIISIYNTVQFFIERGKQIAALAGAVFDSIAEIASGNIGKAVQWVEQALARAVPVVLGFLSRLIGLGDIAEPVRNVIKRVQSVVDQALDKAMEWVARVGAPIINMVKKVAGRIRAGVDAGKAWVAGQAAGLRDRLRGGGGSADAAGAAAATSLAPAVTAANRLLDAPGATEGSVRAALPDLRRQHSLRTADLVQGRSPGSFHIHLQRQEEDTPDKVLSEGASLAAMSDFELFRRYAENETAALTAEIQRRFPDSEAALRRALASNYRPPHSATAKVTGRGGEILWTGSAASGGSTAELRRQLGLWKANQAVHTEPKLIASAAAAGHLIAGATLWITGQYDPCGPCQRAMQAAAANHSIRVRYWWPGGSWSAG
jgi:hypothetical protein